MLRTSSDDPLTVTYEREDIAVFLAHTPGSMLMPVEDLWFSFDEDGSLAATNSMIHYDDPGVAGLIAKAREFLALATPA